MQFQLIHFKTKSGTPRVRNGHRQLDSAWGSQYVTPKRILLHKNNPTAALSTANRDLLSVAGDAKMCKADRFKPVNSFVHRSSGWHLGFGFSQICQDPFPIFNLFWQVIWKINIKLHLKSDIHVFHHSHTLRTS